MSNLRVYAGAEHPHEAQQAEEVDVAAMDPKEHPKVQNEGSLIMAEENKFTELKTTLIKASQAKTEDASKTGDKPRRPGPRLCRRPPQGIGRPRVWIKPGSSKITVNGRDETVYFARPVLRMILRQPLIAAGRDEPVRCGGHRQWRRAFGRSRHAVRHGISRALVNYEPTLHPVLKPGGFLTRDPRAVERKKYGRPKARRSFQFSKR